MRGITGTSSIQFDTAGAVPNPGRSGSCGVAITQVEFDYDAGSGSGATISKVRVHGVSGGAKAIDVAFSSWVLTADMHLSVATASDGSGGFDAEFDVTGQGLLVGILIDVSATINDGGSCTNTTRQSVLLRFPPSLLGDLGLPSATSSAFPSARSPFVAGLVDQLVYSRCFIPLLPSFGEFLMKDRMRLERAGLRSGVKGVRNWIGALERAANAAIRALAKQPSTSSDLPNADVRAALLSAEEQAADKLGRKSKEPIPALELRLSDDDFLLGIPLKAGNVSISASPAEALKLATQGNAFTITKDKFNAPLAGILGVWNHVTLGWLGRLYYDRLRLRPAGLTPGEQVYSLSLAPGEEVTLTQRSETKRSRSFEEVITASDERDLEFNSTWSTDLTQATTDSTTSTQNASLNAGLNIQTPVISANIGGQVSTSTSQTHSVTDTVARHTQMTQRAASKIRREHKTTFKVSTDITEEIGSRRVLRNPNPLRALTLHFFKLYQKVCALLERYDVKLCLVVELRDPGRELRVDVTDALDKLVPIRPASDLAGTTKSEKQKWVYNFNHVSGDEWGEETFVIDITPGMEVRGCEFRIDQIHRKNDYYLGLMEHTEDLSPDLPGDAYASIGGRYSFPDGPPQPGATGHVSLRVRFLFPEQDGEGWWTSQMLVTATFYTGIAQAPAAQDQQSSPAGSDLVTEVVQAAIGKAPDAINRQIITEVLLANYFQAGVSPPLPLLDRVDLDFDWSEKSVEYRPWWITQGAINGRDALRNRFLAVPGMVNVDGFLYPELVGSYARVHLPIKPGCERDAIRLLTARSDLSQDMERQVVELEKDRSLNFASKPRQLDDADHVMGPADSVGTTAGSSTWANSWETPERSFLVLNEWAETVPTDGIHVEPVLSSGCAGDEARVDGLESDLLGSMASRELNLAKADATRGIASRKDLSARVYLKDTKV